MYAILQKLGNNISISVKTKELYQYSRAVKTRDSDSNTSTLRLATMWLVMDQKCVYQER